MRETPGSAGLTREKKGIGDGSMVQSFPGLNGTMVNLTIPRDRKTACNLLEMLGKLGIQPGTSGMIQSAVARWWLFVNVNSSLVIWET